MTEFQKLQFSPGIVRETTRYANAGGWWNSDKVRFRKGYPEKIGGWSKVSEDQFLGSCRCLHQFVDLSGNIYTAIGTHKRFYLETSGTFYELTPWVDLDVDLANPFTTTSGSDEVQVTKVNHGLSVGDRIEIVDSSDVGGITAENINGIREVSSIVNTDNYKFRAGASATSSTTGGGTIVDIYYLLSEGLDAGIYGSGWGSGYWGEGSWGSTGATVSGRGNIRTWNVDNFGEDLLACAWDTGVFYWDASNGVSNTPAARLFPLSEITGASNPPTVGRIAIVSTENRHAIIFGCDSISNPGVMDPLLIRWCDQENIADWTPSTTNTAGSHLLGSGSQIMAALETRSEILIWTDIDLHSMQYVGGQFVFGVKQLASQAQIIGRNAAIVHLNRAFWMGRGAFYSYDGYVVELPCSVKDYVFGDINYNAGDKVYASVNVKFSEITWFYSSAESDEVDKYVTFNYEERVWYFGTLVRTAWIDQTSPSGLPLAAGYDGYLYYHETGNTDGSTNPAGQIVATIESSPMEIGDGYNFMQVDLVIPDVTFRDVAPGIVPSVSMTLTMYDAPGMASYDSGSGSVIRSASIPVEQFTSEVPVRIRGRSMAVSVSDTSSSSDFDFGWRLGMPRIRIRTDGRR